MMSHYVQICDDGYSRQTSDSRPCARGDDENLALRPDTQCPTKVHRRARVPDERSQAVGPITTTGTDESASSLALTFHDYYLPWHGHSATFLLVAVAAAESCADGRLGRPRAYRSSVWSLWSRECSGLM